MSETSYEDILNRSVDELPEPKLLPAGSWVLKATGGARYVAARDENSKAQVRFFYEPVEPLSDVDDDQLEELGADYDYGNNILSFSVWIERETDWRKVVDHVKKHGVDTEGLTVKEAMAAVKSARIVGAVTQRQYLDKNTQEQRTVNDVNKFVAEE